jgi:hypothetical protein
MNQNVFCRKNEYIPGLKQNTSRSCVMTVTQPNAEESFCSILDPKYNDTDTDIMSQTITSRMFSIRPLQIRCNPRFYPILDGSEIQ